MIKRKKRIPYVVGRDKILSIICNHDSFYPDLFIVNYLDSCNKVSHLRCYGPIIGDVTCILIDDSFFGDELSLFLSLDDYKFLVNGGELK